MFRQYLIASLRNLKKNKLFNFINIIGLTSGIACCYFISLYVFEQFAFEKDFPNASKITRLMIKIGDERTTALTSPLLAQKLESAVPQLEKITRLVRLPGTDEHLLNLTGNKSLQEAIFQKNGYLADQNFFEVFQYTFLFGNPKTCLDSPNSVVLSEQLSRKLFGNVNPIGEILNIENPWGTYECKITGVFINDIKSHIPAQFLININTGEAGMWIQNNQDWLDESGNFTYALLKNRRDLDKINNHLQRSSAAIFPDGVLENDTPKLSLEPIEEIHFSKELYLDLTPHVDYQQIVVLALIGLLIFLIACLNYINLFLASFAKRVRDVGVRKVFGARKNQLIIQYMTEAILVAGVAFVIAVGLAYILVPQFEAIAGATASIQSSLNSLLIAFILTTVAGICAGVVPAIYVVSISPIEALKKHLNFSLINKFRIGKIKTLDVIVIIQFTIATVLIAGVLIVREQMQYINNKDLGYNTSMMVVIPLKTIETEKAYNILKNRLLDLSQVSNVSACTSYPGIPAFSEVELRNPEMGITETVKVNLNNVDDGYLELLDISKITGRYLDVNYPSDTLGFGNLVVNEATLRHLGMDKENALGKTITVLSRGNEYDIEIVGVVEDHHFESLHKAIAPQAYRRGSVSETGFGYVIAEVSTSLLESNFSSLQKIWEETNPLIPFEISMLDDKIQLNYQEDQKTFTTISIFSIVAVILASLGLFGLALHTLKKKKKEIGIRKVLGASVARLTFQLMKDFLRLVLLSLIISLPLAYFFMDKWLLNFEYRISLSLGIFLATACLSVAIATITLVYHTTKAALSNPINTLKVE